MNLDYRKGEINFADLNSESEYDPDTAFYQSQLANMLTVTRLAKHWNLASRSNVLNDSAKDGGVPIRGALLQTWSLCHPLRSTPVCDTLQVSLNPTDKESVR